MSDETFGSSESAAADDTGSGFNLAEYWQVVVKRWKLIVACIVLFLGWAVLNTILTPPSYRATAVLDIEQDRGNPLDAGSTAQMFFSYNPDYLPTQLRLLTSREMAERAAERLNLVADRTLNPKVSGLLKGQPASDQERTTDDAITGAALGIQGGIAVNQIKDTNLVELSYVDSNPKRAADIANAISEAYIDWTAESKYRAIGQASRYLSSQIEQLRSELETKQKELYQFGGPKNLGGTDSQIVSTLQGTDSMKNEYAAAVADRISKQARYDEARNAADSTLADAATNPLITQLRTDQAKLEREYAEKLNVFKPDWPAMRQLKTEIDKGRQHLSAVTKDAADKAREAAKTDYLTAVRREEGFTTAVREQRQQAVQFTSSSIEYNNLRVEVDTKRTLLDALLKKQTEMEMISRTTGERVTPVRIVDPALKPTYRFSPSYRHNASRGLFMGIAAGLALCFFLEYLDRSLRTVEQVENFLKLPALGVIPSVGAESTRAYGYGYGHGARRKSLKAQKASDAHGRRTHDRAHSAHAAPLDGGRGVPRRANGAASLASRRREIDHGDVLPPAGGEVGDIRESRRRVRAARQEGPSRGCRPPQAEGARDPSRLESRGPRLRARGKRGPLVGHREDRDPGRLHFAGRTDFPEPFRSSLLSRDDGVSRSRGRDVRLRDHRHSSRAAGRGRDRHRTSNRRRRVVRPRREDGARAGSPHARQVAAKRRANPGCPDQQSGSSAGRKIRQSI